MQLLEPNQILSQGERKILLMPASLVEEEEKTPEPACFLRNEALQHGR
jgi:hypothetical protein